MRWCGLDAAAADAVAPSALAGRFERPRSTATRFAEQVELVREADAISPRAPLLQERAEPRQRFLQLPQRRQHDASHPERSAEDQQPTQASKAVEEPAVFVSPAITLPPPASPHAAVGPVTSLSAAPSRHVQVVAEESPSRAAESDCQVPAGGGNGEEAGNPPETEIPHLVRSSSRHATVLFFDPHLLHQSSEPAGSAAAASTSSSKHPGRVRTASSGSAGGETGPDQLGGDDQKRSPRTRPRKHIGRTRSSSSATSVGGGGGGAEFIQVAIRIRPMLERNRRERDVLSVGGGSEGVGGSQPKGVAGRQITIDMAGTSTNQNNKRAFQYDYVFDSRGGDKGPMASQDDVHATLGERVVRSALGGYNACIFAYGQTGTGKTHTVLGHGGLPQDRGLLPRILETLFAQIARSNNTPALDVPKAEAPASTLSMRISYLEIFNEQIYDLLAPPSMRSAAAMQGKGLQARCHPTFGVVINDLTEAVATSLPEAMELLDFGTRMRSVASTSMNSRSSRAHTVFTFCCDQTTSSTGESKIAQVQIIDLAGREQEKSSVDDRARLRERQFINTSLFHLSMCIMHLSRNTKNPKSQNSADWTFRNSKLTVVLAPSLSGNSRTAMIATVSPAASEAEETLSTLRFADSVQRIKTTVSCNRVNKTSVVQDLQEEIVRLKQEMQQQRVRVQNDELHEQVQQLEAVCASFAERLEQEQNRSKALAAERAECLRDLGLSVGADGVSLLSGREGGSQVPYLVNLSEDPCLQGCLMYFLRGPEEVSIGSAPGNTIHLEGLGIQPHHCAIKNEGNQQLFLHTFQEQCRVFLNGNHVGLQPLEMRHGDRLVLGHGCAFRVVLGAHRLQAKSQESLAEKADLEQALAEIEDSSSGAFQHLRKFVEDLERCAGADVVGAFVREAHVMVSLVEEANQITREIGRDEIDFTLQVLTDLSVPEIVVAVISRVTSRVKRLTSSSTSLRLSASGRPLPAQPDVTTATRDSLSFVWTREKFKERLQGMRDVYEETRRCGLEYVQERLEAEPYTDPWKEIGAGEVQVLIDGVSWVPLEGGNGQLGVSLEDLRKAGSTSSMTWASATVSPALRGRQGSEPPSQAPRSERSPSFEAAAATTSKVSLRGGGSVSSATRSPLLSTSQGATPQTTSPQGTRTSSSSSLDREVDSADPSVEYLSHWYNLGRRASTPRADVASIEPRKSPVASSLEGSMLSRGRLGLQRPGPPRGTNSASTSPIQEAAVQDAEEDFMVVQHPLSNLRRDAGEGSRGSDAGGSRRGAAAALPVAGTAVGMAGGGTATLEALAEAPEVPCSPQSLASWEEHLRQREEKLLAWAEQLAKKEQTLQQIEEVTVKLRRLRCAESSASTPPPPKSLVDDGAGRMAVAVGEAGLTKNVVATATASAAHDFVQSGVSPRGLQPSARLSARR